MGAHFPQTNVNLLGTANDSLNYIYTSSRTICTYSRCHQILNSRDKWANQFHRESSSLQMGSRRKRAVPRKRVR